MPAYHEHNLKRARVLFVDTQKRIESRFYSPATSSQDSLDNRSIDRGKSFS